MIPVLLEDRQAYLMKVSYNNNSALLLFGKNIAIKVGMQQALLTNT